MAGGGAHIGGAASFGGSPLPSVAGLVPYSRFAWRVIIQSIISRPA